MYLVTFHQRQNDVCCEIKTQKAIKTVTKTKGNNELLLLLKATPSCFDALK